ncbi:hypothetical protein Tco_0190561 [Tanacetum coccineum]
METWIRLMIDFRTQSQLEIHGAYVSKEDINQKFLRSLPPSWSQIALIMRNKPDIDEVDIDDLYNNLRVYEDELKRSSGSNSASQNLAFLSFENTNNTRSIEYKQMDGDDLEELDLRWQVAMLTVRIKEDDLKCDNAVSHTQTTESLSQASAISSSNLTSSSDSEVQKCSKCLESFKCLQKNYDTEREKHNKAKLEIKGYEIALESLEARILGHEKNELAWATIVKPKSVNETVVSKSKINRDEVIIEDWTSDDEDDVCAVKTVSSVKPKCDSI